MSEGKQKRPSQRKSAAAKRAAAMLVNTPKSWTLVKLPTDPRDPILLNLSALVEQLEKEPVVRLQENQAAHDTTLLVSSPDKSVDCSQGAECVGLGSFISRSSLCASDVLRLGQGRVLCQRMTVDEHKTFLRTGQAPSYKARCVLCMRKLLTAWITFAQVNMDHHAFASGKLHISHLGVTKRTQGYDQKYVLSTPSTLPPGASCMTVKPAFLSLSWTVASRTEDSESTPLSWRVDQSMLLIKTGKAE